MSKSVLTTIAGAAAAPFTGGASLLGAAAINAGTQLIGAKMASNSAKNAAKTQTDSANRAIDLQRDLYNQQQARLSPFIAQGASAAQSLGQMGNQPTPTFNGAMPQGGWNAQSLGQIGQPDTVNMRTPQGQVVKVPRNMVAQAQAQGGQIVP